MKNLEFTKPAENFGEAIIVSNGRLGAKSLGGTGHETIKLYEESLWSGAWYDRNNSQFKHHLGHIRETISQGRLSEAKEEAFETMTAIPARHTEYRHAGEIHIDFYDPEHYGFSDTTNEDRGNFSQYDSYKRQLDYSNCVSSSQFSVQTNLPSTADFSRGSTGSSVTFTREFFASVSGNVLVYHIESSIPKSIFFRARIEKDGCAKKLTYTNDTVAMLDVTGIPFCVMMTAGVSGGTVKVHGENLIVEKADEVTLYIDIESAYRFHHFRAKSGDVHKKPLSAAVKCADLALRRICFASGTSYASLKANQTSACEKLGNRGFFEGNEELVSRWNYSKYLAFSQYGYCSTLPKVTGGICSDINADSIASFANRGLYSAGLYSLNTHLKPFAKRMYKKGKLTAREMYGIEGFVCHGPTDIWGDTAPCGTNLAENLSPLGTLEIVRAIMDHYEYTLDRNALKKNLKLLKSACRFFLAYTVEVNEKQNLVMVPSSNFAIGEKQQAEDNSAILEVFQLFLKAMDYLGNKSDSLCIEVKAAADKLLAAKNSEVNKSGDFIFDTVNSIIACRINDSKVEVSLLENATGELATGSLSRIKIRGNLWADISWKDGRLESGRLYTKQGTEFLRCLTVIYQGKEYNTQLSEDGSIELKNVLPSTF